MRPAWEANPSRSPLEFTPEIIFVLAFCAAVLLFSCLCVYAWHLTRPEVVELDGYLVLLGLAVFLAGWFPLTGRRRREG